MAEKIGCMNRQFRHKMEPGTIHEVTKQCCRQWHERIMPEFRNDGQSWIVNFELPAGFNSGLQHGQLELANDEIVSCFSLSVGAIETMMLQSIERMSHDGQGARPSVGVTHNVSQSCSCSCRGLTLFSICLSLGPTPRPYFCATAWRRLWKMTAASTACRSRCFWASATPGALWHWGRYITANGVDICHSRTQRPVGCDGERRMGQ